MLMLNAFVKESKTKCLPGLNEVTSVLYISLIAFSSFSLRLGVVDENVSITFVAFCESIESIVVGSLKH